MKKKNGFPAVLASLLLLGILTGLILRTVSAASGASDDCSEGLRVLQTAEERQPETVIEFLRQREEEKRAEEERRRQEELARLAEEERARREEEERRRKEAERQAFIRQLMSGEIDVWSQFEDYVLLGDSRAVGFYYYDFLEHSRVLADGGNTIRNAEWQMSQIVAMAPKYVFLCYGINDVGIGFWNTPEDYAAEMRTLLTELQEKLPEAVIVVSSILPAYDPAFELSSKWYQIPEYSAAVAEVCKELGVCFADNTEISAQYANLWQPDGIHLCPAFYPYWARNLILSMYEGTYDEE